MKTKNLTVVALITSILLVIPFVAMQFTPEVNWSVGDFVIAGALLFGTGFLIDLAIRKIPNRKNRILICIAIALALVILWIDLAVGIFGMPWSGS
ncbi:hypothetical protein [Flavobacterium sp.]|uniref:hypothetical protein n=1 Tax=Flavobacterium sp. TaxID=239 RepID=UPI0028BF46A8|nr:hypothetical protein [Flavobacterium sp.]